ncbi:MAG: hypothetical protein WBL61_25120 [Bryobacteraceae bacterium]
MTLSRCLPIAFALACSMAPLSTARIMEVLSYRQLLDRSDLVVIATPASKTADTKEESFLPNIFSQDNDGKKSRIRSIGVETSFEVCAVLKGDTTIRQFVLHHYREAVSKWAALSGPMLVSFDPSDTSKRSYLLFLIREADGRYAPAGGQTDPGYKAISALPLEGPR